MTAHTQSAWHKLTTANTQILQQSHVQMLARSLTHSCSPAQQWAVACVHLQWTFMTDGRHFEEPSSITPPKGTTTWNNKSLLCSFLLLLYFCFFLCRLLAQQGWDITWHTPADDKTVRHMRREKKKQGVGESETDLHRGLRYVDR